jgi:Protein of unknown function (DUF4058)
VALLSEALQAILPRPYYAEISERVWIEVSHRLIEPDASVLRGEGGSSSRENGSSAATATRSRCVVVSVPSDDRREAFVEIYASRADGDRLVTAIEILSPSNKTPGERGRDLYLRKQRELLESRTHLVEIDLLRSGTHTTAVPLEGMAELVGPFDYHVAVHRSDRFEEFVTYPFRLDEPLPEIAIPLLADDKDVVIDLQTIFHRAYDTGPYRRRVDYAGRLPAPPPLRPEQEAWATRLLRDAVLVT